MTLFFVHGLGSNKKIWGPLIQELKEEKGCLAIDLPGHGNDTSFFPKTIAEVCSYLESDLIKNKVNEKIVFIGHSLGGLIGILFTSLFPEKVEKLILINTHYKIDLHPLVVQSAQNGAILSDFVLQSIGPTADPACKERILREVGPLLLNTSLEGIADLDVLDLKELAQKIHCPTLIFAGGQDPVLSPRKTALLASSIPQSCLNIFPDAGHYVHVEKQTETIQMIKEFLRR
ncbi:MAG: hypothetical protein A3F67_01255 [Verrucomicrobia bacterium RIFCSPHIGHO2_12_FULL_41_10]|nr:MAG: hypothetical protein A3F67_01255 [Verrucomicrobia bacterium RIFCSPHIGHO2_12_FULL_41_10]